MLGHPLGLDQVGLGGDRDQLGALGQRGDLPDQVACHRGRSSRWRAGRRRPRRPRSRWRGPGRSAARRAASAACAARGCRSARAGHRSGARCPRIACRVVCGLDEAMAILLPTSALINVDLPALGRPTKQAKPERNPAGWARTLMRSVTTSTRALRRRLRRPARPRRPSRRRSRDRASDRSPASVLGTDHGHGLQAGGPGRHRHGDRHLDAPTARRAAELTLVAAYVRPSVSRTAAPSAAWCGRGRRGPG